jgi:drug/metabolite transporter (DMT)-like permease
MTDAASLPERAGERPPQRPIDATAALMGVAFAAIWSSAFTSAKIALADAPPFLMLGLRFAISGVVAVAIAAAMGQRLPRSRWTWTLIALFGICQNTLYLGLNFLAMTTVPAGLAAIIASALPLIVAAMGWARGESLSALGLFGLATGFAGVVLIMWGRIGGGVDPQGVALCLIGLLALAVATRVVAGATAGGGLLMAVGLQMLVGSATLFPIGFLFESPDAVNPTLSLALAFAYTTIMPGVVATLIWFALVNRIGATAASAFHFLNPGLGVGTAALVLGEPLSWIDAGGVAIVTLGIAAVQLAKRRAQLRR